MVTSKSIVSVKTFYFLINVVYSVSLSLSLPSLSSLKYKGKDVPGEVRTLEISPINPKQVCGTIHVHTFTNLLYQLIYTILYTTYYIYIHVQCNFVHYS